MNGVFDANAPELRPIPTDYRGTRFRSRLEARWAMFFDEMGLGWLYEPEGFRFDAVEWLGVRHGDVGYLPDFFIPSIETWVEIKPQHPTARERACCASLANASKRRAVLFYGHPGFWLDDSPVTDSGELFLPGDGWDSSYLPCECPRCGKVDIQFEGRADRIECLCPRASKDRGRGHNAGSARIRAAAATANAHRFWNGGSA